MRGSLNEMADSTEEGTTPDRPPLGSWARIYTLCCVLAVLVMAPIIVDPIMDFD